VRDLKSVFAIGSNCGGIALFTASVSQVQPWSRALLQHCSMSKTAEAVALLPLVNVEFVEFHFVTFAAQKIRRKPDVLSFQQENIPPQIVASEFVEHHQSIVTLSQHVFYLRMADDGRIVHAPDFSRQRRDSDRYPRRASATPQPARRSYAYGLRSPGGRVLKRLCNQKYCSGISRAVASMNAFMRRVSVSRSAPGKSCHAGYSCTT